MLFKDMFKVCLDHIREDKMKAKSRLQNPTPSLCSFSRTDDADHVIPFILCYPVLSPCQSHVFPCLYSAHYYFRLSLLTTPTHSLKTTIDGQLLLTKLTLLSLSRELPISDVMM